MSQPTHHGDHAAQFRDRFWLSLLLALPVVVFSQMFADLLGYDRPSFPGSELVSPVLGTVVYGYGGWPFLSGAVGEVRARRPGMMLLVAMAITVAFVASWATTLGVGGVMLDFWWELVLLVVIMLLGHWLEMRALGAASGALDALAALLPDLAERVEGDGVVEVALTDLEPGDVVLVRAGARVPADGSVVDGEAEVDESMITGESRPVVRADGDRVVAGTVATDSSLRVRVEATGDDTALAGIQRLVAEAQASSSRAQALADRAAALLFWFALGAAAVTAVVWSSVGSPTDAVTRTVTVLVIACPHALGLAIPLVIALSTERAARTGILVTDRSALERMRLVDVVLFDKTGTLTRGEPVVVGAVSADAVSADAVVVPAAGGGTGEDVGLDAGLLELAASVEQDSEHPLARAVVRAAAEHGSPGTPPVASEVRSLPGRGVRGQVDGVTVAVGGPAVLAELGLTSPTSLRSTVDAWAGDGATVLHVVRDGSVVGVLALADEVRPESAAAVAELHRQGVRVGMITGDARAVAESVARRLGMDLARDDVLAEVLPQDKEQQVRRLQQAGATVAMVGDGVNDAPALARADVGIAIGAGTDVAVESAGVVLASDDPRGVVGVITLSRAGYRKMLQNLWWAAGYNIAAVPLAAGVLAPVGFVLSPAVGAVLMSVSTVVVALNAQLLRRLDLSPG